MSLKTRGSQLIPALTLMVSLGLLAGCSKGLQTVDQPSAADGINGGQGGDSNHGGGSSAGRSWNDLQSSVNGSVSGSAYDGQMVIQIDPENQALILVLPLPSIFLLNVPSMMIPQLPGAALFPMTQPDGSSSMAVRIPLKYLIRGAQLSNYNTLPNGDPLPFMPVGENRGFAISFPQNPKYRLHLYISANAAAVFVETPDFKLPEQWIILPSLGFRIKNRDKTADVGYFAIVANRGQHSSGVYVSSRLPTEAAILIDELLRY